jgi:hypothetical protein
MSSEVGAKDLERPPASPNAPSTHSLVRAITGSLASAIVLLVTVILPAEYGRDPLGTGRLLGLTAMAGGVREVVTPAIPEGARLVPTANGPMASYSGEFKVDSRALVLGPYEYVEFKYRLEQGATMLFSWTASDAVVHDFHGDQDGAPADAPTSYDKQPRRRADGSFVAPFSGIHGWFWENPGGDPITITLTTAGFYTSATEFHVDRSRHPREVGGLDRITSTPVQKEPVP